MKMPALFAAAAVAACFALPGSAQSAEQKAHGLRNSDQVEVSSARRHRRYVRRYWRPRYAYRPYYRPYYYRPYSYYRPYYRAYWGPRPYWGGPGVYGGWGWRGPVFGVGFRVW